MTKTLIRPTIAKSHKSAYAAGLPKGVQSIEEMSLEQIEILLGDATSIQRSINGVRVNPEVTAAMNVEIFNLLKIYADPNAENNNWIPKMVQELHKKGLCEKLIAGGDDLPQRFWAMVNARRSWMKKYIESRKKKK